MHAITSESSQDGVISFKVELSYLEIYNERVRYATHSQLSQLPHRSTWCPQESLRSQKQMVLDVESGQLFPFPSFTHFGRLLILVHHS